MCLHSKHSEIANFVTKFKFQLSFTCWNTPFINFNWQHRNRKKTHQEMRKNVNKISNSIGSQAYPRSEKLNNWWYCVNFQFSGLKVVQFWPYLSLTCLPTAWQLLAIISHFQRLFFFLLIPKAKSALHIRVCLHKFSRLRTEQTSPFNNNLLLRVLYAFDLVAGHLATFSWYRSLLSTQKSLLKMVLRCIGLWQLHQYALHHTNHIDYIELFRRFGVHFFLLASD